MSLRPLSGIRVLDLTRVIAGPMATQMLADLGAEVIKVERPIHGDDARRFGPVFLENESGHGMTNPAPDSACYLGYNRNKKDITVNIADPAGQDIIRRLAAKSDVLVENYKAGDLERYRLDYASLAATNPELVYCSITGFGQSGPYRDRPGYDPIFQAIGGLMSLTGLPDGVPGGGPMKVGPPVADIFGGFYAAVAVMAALYHRDQHGGGGQHIDLALLDSLVATLGKEGMNFLVGGHVTTRKGSDALGGGISGSYPCQDGTMVFAVGSQSDFERFCTALQLGHLPSDARYANSAARAKNKASLREVIEQTTRARSVQSVLESLSRAGIACGAVNDVSQVFADPQLRHRGVTVETEHASGKKVPLLSNPMRFSKTPITEYKAPPTLGQHTREVLSELLGIDDAALDALRSKGAV